MTIGIGAVNTDPDATAVAATLAAYFGGIDARNYRQAWDTYRPASRRRPLQSFAKELSTTQETQVTVQSIQHDEGGNIEADISFQSHQAGQYGPNPGETCTDWTLDYHLVPRPPSPRRGPALVPDRQGDIHRTGTYLVLRRLRLAILAAALVAAPSGCAAHRAGTRSRPGATPAAGHRQAGPRPAPASARPARGPGRRLPPDAARPRCSAPGASSAARPSSSSCPSRKTPCSRCGPWSAEGAGGIILFGSDAPSAPAR